MNLLKPGNKFPVKLIILVSLTGLLVCRDIPYCDTDTFKRFLPSGYAVETHQITTEDGYILRVFRVQKGKKIRKKKRVALIMHGLNNSADKFVLNDEDSLPMILADKDFDVWVGNNRGNKFGTKHLEMTPHQREFWDFSWQEMGESDVPAHFSYIHRITRNKKINYVGHSQGTTQMFAGLSDPISRAKISPYLGTFYAMAPVLSLAHNRQGVVPIANIGIPTADELARALSLGYLGIGKCHINEAKYIKKVTKCTRSPFSCQLPYWPNNAYPMILNPRTIAKIDLLGNSGVSLRSFLHYGQNIQCWKKKIPCFRKFDFGKKKNLIRYGTEKPPLYDLDIITDRVRFFCGTGDLLASMQDCLLDAELLKNANIEVEKIKHWGHQSFISNKNARLVLEKLADDMIINS